MNFKFIQVNSIIFPLIKSSKLSDDSSGLACQKVLARADNPRNNTRN